MRVGDMRGRGVRVCFRHFFDVRGRDMRVRDGQAQAACFAGECVHGRVLATNISSARVFITPVRVDRPRQKRPLRRHASASGITFVAHVEVRAVAIRQSRRAPRFAAAHALASAIRDVLARGRMPATCSFAACVLRHARARDVRAMCIPASHACIGRARRHHDTRRLARQAPRIAHVERAGRLPGLDPTRSGSIRLYSALFGSNQIDSNRACRARCRIAPFIDSAPSLHASATAPRIAPPAAVNPHRNCGDTRPDSSPRCA
ncbi:hypothetical protein Y033_2503 [Burkholderia pseudomallei MSHR435]|nr:hypothetical protein Y034_5887 [Burkholderia pseudomallei MSHR449]KGX76823.1 hypothetical protein Y033_2503 [Burkholderia pseudomallei MSHR435]